MATKKELEKKWRRTLLHFAFAVVGIFGVIIALFIKQINGGDGPSFENLLAIAAAVMLFSVAFYFAGRSIKNMIIRRFGEN